MADQTRRQSDFSVEGFSVFWLLKRIGVADAEPIARCMEAAFAAHRYWRQSPAQEMNVRRGLYKALIEAKVEKMPDVVGYILSVLRRAR